MDTCLQLEACIISWAVPFPKKYPLAMKFTFLFFSIRLEVNKGETAQAISFICYNLLTVSVGIFHESSISLKNILYQ
jgi:hypothetical protein